MKPTPDKVPANIFRPSLLAWRAEYLASKAAAPGSAPKPLPQAARQTPGAAERR